MDANQTIEYFDSMGLLDECVFAHSGKILLILASATPAHAFFCMRLFGDREGFVKTSFGIDAITADGIPVKMTFLN